MNDPTIKPKPKSRLRLPVTEELLPVTKPTPKPRLRLPVTEDLIPVTKPKPTPKPRLRLPVTEDLIPVTKPKPKSRLRLPVTEELLPVTKPKPTPKPRTNPKAMNLPIEILPKGLVHYKNVIENADGVMKRLLLLPWVKKSWGRGNLPRLTYTSDVYPDPNLVSLQPYMDQFSMDGLKISGIWGNYYRNGNDYTPYHRDNYNCDVYCYSFGETRRVLFKHNKTGKITELVVKSGDMYMFDPVVDREYTHSVPKQSGSGARISILFFVERF